MTNNKFVQTALILFASGIWAVIIFKAIRHFSPVSPSSPQIEQTPEVVNSSEDTLCLEYCDPFLGTSPPVPGKVSVQKINTPPPTETTEPPPSIRYKGIICKGKEQFIFFEENGETILHAVGASFMGYRIISWNEDSVRLTGNRHIFTLYPE